MESLYCVLQLSENCSAILREGIQGRLLSASEHLMESQWPSFERGVIFTLIYR